MNIKDMIKDNTVKFIHYKDSDLWYTLKYGENKSFDFPVPINDVGTATMLAQDKAILFMRYIRKHIKNIENNG